MSPAVRPFTRPCTEQIRPVSRVRTQDCMPNPPLENKDCLPPLGTVLQETSEAGFLPSFFYFPREGHRISKQFLMQIVNLGSRCTRYPRIEFRVYEHGWEKHYNLFSLYSTKIKHLLIINVGNKTQQYLVPEIL